MTTDTDMKIDYAMVLKQLQEELDGIDDRRQALVATIAGMKRLIVPEEQHEFPLPFLNARVQAAGAPVITKMFMGSDGVIPVPPGFFADKTPTQAYRDLMKLWPGEYKPPQIADAFIAGGMAAKNRTELVQSIHSVLKRERQRKAKERELVGESGAAA